MTTGAKMRVYEIAKELEIPNKELIAKIRALGLEVNNHMSSLDADEVARVKRSLERERLAATETKRLSSTVLRRRSKGERTRRRVAAGPESAPVSAPAQAEASRPVTRRPARRGDNGDSTQAAPPQAAPVVSARPAPRPEPAPKPAVAKPAPRETERVAKAPADGAAASTPSAPPAPPAPEARVQTPPPAPEPAPAPAPAAPVEAREPAPAPTPAAPERPAAEAPAAPERPAAEAPRAPAAEAPAKTEPSPAPAAAETAADSAAAAPAEPKREPRAPVVVPGPPSVNIPGVTPPPAPPRVASAPAAPAPEPERPRAAQPAAQAGVDEGGGDDDGTETGQDVTENARSRFEEELIRARRRVEEREAAEREKREREAAKLAEERDPSRPAVGTVINLPSQTRIKITERKPAPRPGTAGARDRFGTRGRPTRQKRDFGRKRPLGKKPGKQTVKTTPAEHKRVIRMEDTIAISELAKGMGVKANEVLKKLWGMGMLGVNINAAIDHETAQILASEFGYEVQNVAFKEEEIFTSEPDTDEDLDLRSPVVTVMGHVDHGKTSLLDAIRESRVAAGEAGGITQHIAAYKVSAGEDLGDVVFLDTPGHEAFTAMRARGAQATDIAVLVVAANDGVMPQTLEALSHAKDAKVSIIVAVNKCDLPDAQPERVRQQLADHGLIPEEWGGDTIYADVSAATGEGIPQLIEAIALSSELLELRANPDKPARGIVIEAKLDRARGPMATVLVQEGTLKTSDVVVAGRYYGKVRAILDDQGNVISEAGPSTPIELLGLDGVPEAGETLNVADDEKTAKQVVEHRRQAQRKRELATTAKVSIENLMERISEGESHELKVVLKADVQGSAEALKASLIKQSTDKVKVNVIQAGVGGITETDVNLAKAGGAIIVGFHVRPAGKAAKHAEQEGVEIRLYDVIYECLEDVRLAMAGLLAPIKREQAMGTLEVRDTFTIPRVGTVAGCMVTGGKVQRKSLLRVIRDSVLIYEGRVGSLRRFKEDTGEVKEGYECGLMVQGFNDIKVGDVIESYEIVEEAAQL
ncbi:translation initiation factor IF-2 [Haliangium sp.]|uniref:translation initiation factor IF-2 n=1 Tax=Haliangium sp. TaxID=2663208 RepID=UPI003D0FDB88